MAVTWPVAKVNLELSVGPRRPDGFHEIRTVFQAVDLADMLRVEVGGEGIDLVVDGAELGPPGENLCYRAAKAFRSAAGWERGVRMRLLKAIPAGAGLGGGSSDAASALRALNALAGRPLTDDGLIELGAALGSDVPFFLGPATRAFGRGRGERLEALSPLPAASLVLVMPPVHVDTTAAYGALARHRQDASGNRRETAGDDAVALSWAEVAERAHNDFEGVISELPPPVGEGLAALRARGARPALVCGSGGAGFGVFESWAAARSTAAEVEAELGWPAVAVRTLSSFPTVVHAEP